MPLVCTTCNRLRASEDKQIGVILAKPETCAICDTSLSQATVHKIDKSDVRHIREAISSATGWSPTCMACSFTQFGTPCNRHRLEPIAKEAK